MKPIQLKLAAIAISLVCALSSCQEHIEEGARFTFVGKTVATYLESEKEQFSSFVEILTRGECLGLMKAYGQYTCFAPTNEAVDNYLKEQFSIYENSIATGDTIDTGVYSTELSELSKAKCVEIARNHILSKMYLGVDLIGNQIPAANMNDRNLTLDFDTVNNKRVALINSTAPVLYEEEVENGVVHAISGVLNPSTLGIAKQVKEYDYFNVFYQALDSTGYANKMVGRDDPLYTEGDKIVKSIRATEDANYPANRYFGYTVFLVPDDVLKEKYGVEDLEGLEKLCEEEIEEGSVAWTFNEKTNDWDTVHISHKAPYKSPRNPVNQFIAYHLLDRRVPCESLVCYNIKTSGNGGSFDSEKDFPGTAERTEYYVTMNNRILKVTMPRGDERFKLGKIFRW